VAIVPEMVNLPNEKLIATLDTLTELVLSLSQKLTYFEVSHTVALYKDKGMDFHTVTNQDETFDVVNQMVRNGISKETKPYAFDYFQAMDEQRNYSHLVYITNTLDVDVLSKLEDFTATRKTVFCITATPIEEKFLSYDGVQVVQIVPNMIAQSVSEFIV
jgi:hypothetical protein